MSAIGTGKTERFGSVGARHRRMSRIGRDVLTERDVDIVRWVYETRLATREQVHRLFFSAGGRSRCQDRLTALFRHRYLDRLPHRSVNEMDVYLVSRRAIRGLAPLRTMFPELPVSPFRAASARVPHILDISSVRTAITRAMTGANIQLLFWLNEEDLAEQTASSGIIPDAYFQLSRQTPDGVKRSAYFVEVERSTKSKQALEQRFQRYANFYYGQTYERLFGTKALRLLFIVGSDYNLNPARHVAVCSEICEQLHLTLARFTTLDVLLNEPTDQLLTAQLWQQPGNPTPISLL